MLVSSQAGCLCFWSVTGQAHTCGECGGDGGLTGQQVKAELRVRGRDWQVGMSQQRLRILSDPILSSVGFQRRNPVLSSAREHLYLLRPVYVFLAVMN